MDNFLAAGCAYGSWYVPLEKAHNPSNFFYLIADILILTKFWYLNIFCSSILLKQNFHRVFMCMRIYQMFINPILQWFSFSNLFYASSVKIHQFPYNIPILTLCPYIIIFELALQLVVRMDLGKRHMDPEWFNYY